MANKTICRGYTCGTMCIGNCPIALRDEYAARGMDYPESVPSGCADCPYYGGCAECMWEHTDLCCVEDGVNDER